jgi:hypothetical protein
MKPLTISFLLLDNHHHYPWQPYDKLSLHHIILKMGIGLLIIINGDNNVDN